MLETMANAGQNQGRGFTFVDDLGGETRASWAELMRRARCAGQALLERGLRRGDRVVLVLPDTQEFISLFLGCVWTGLVPVPIYPPLGMGKLSGYLDNAVHVIDAARASAVVTDRMVRKVLGSLLTRSRTLREVVLSEQLLGGRREAAPAQVTPEDICFLQFTSGSTSRPRGVTVTHANLIENTRCIGGEALDLQPHDVGISWLPLYHDMGLIGFVFVPLVYQCDIVSMTPMSFLKRPLTWLQTMTRHRGTISYAPNFAYALCTRRITDRQLEDLDLSAWTFAGCGAEPINAETMEAFCDRFSRCGFRPEALFPSYGMAEATLGVAFVSKGEGVTARSVDRDALAKRHLVEPVPPERDNAQRIVSCGRPFSGHELAILGADAKTLGEGQVGEIALRGPSVMPGYFENPEATRGVLRGGWLHTGDLGFVLDGEVYVCGRKKELIIVGGKNYYPQDIERLAWDVPGVRAGNVIAFGVARGDREHVVVAVERQSSALTQAIPGEVSRRVAEHLGLKVDEVVVLAPGTLPKTSSGKLQRRKTAQLYQEGLLASAGQNVGRLGVLRHLAASQLGYARSVIGRMARR
jgi:fatty-acyl-CoA synthase